MSTNRLHLNWELTSKTERSDFINKYIETLLFTPTEEELQMMGNYILWGKNNPEEKDGLSRLKTEGIFIPTRTNDWTDDKTESLDALIENPSFAESQFLPKGVPPTKKTRQVFSREEAKRLAPPEVLQALTALWSQIDRLQLIISFYDLYHNRRSTPIRESLLSTFPSSELSSLESKSKQLSQYKYFKLKHRLIELRQQQYTYQDSYKTTILPQKIPLLQFEDLEFGEDIPILPLTLKYNTPFYKKLFPSSTFPSPDIFTEQELQNLSTLLWKGSSPKLFFDFSDPTHLYNLYSQLPILLQEQEKGNSSIRIFLQTLRYYEELSNLSPLQKDILDLKVQGATNQNICSYIEEKYNHKYQDNYISTLYRKKILPQIAATASLHREVCANLFFPENFKTCADCAQTLLLVDSNWVKRQRSRDGYSPRCKRCEKKKRERNKLK